MKWRRLKKNVEIGVYGENRVRSVEIIFEWCYSKINGEMIVAIEQKVEDSSGERFVSLIRS